MTDHDQARLNVERALGYRFQDSLLLQLALTSPALAHEYRQRGHAASDWKDLEWLGDAMVYLAATLSKLSEGSDRGTRTPERGALVSNEALADLGRRIGVADALLLTGGDRKNIDANGDQKYLSQATEAMFGALFVDLRQQGLPAWSYSEHIVRGHLRGRPAQAWVPGSPAPGESSGEAAWRESVRLRTDELGPGPRCLGMALVVARGRTPDIDNLARPVLDGLRAAGWYETGFPGLDDLIVRRVHAPCVGAVLRGDADPVVLQEVIIDAHLDSVPPSDRTKDWIQAWSNAIQAATPGSSGTGHVSVIVDVRTDRSLKDLMKPILDGVEPWLGRDPAGRSRFAPQDERIDSLQIRRVDEGPAVRLRGSISKPD